ncbi:hypothetical protein TNCV_1264861 [Trichonephila clavipes]|nr:hypothetical protein TNCV_1264861 [Trichonephila clavipes]
MCGKITGSQHLRDVALAGQCTGNAYWKGAPVKPPPNRVQDQKKRDSSVNTMAFHSVLYVHRSSYHWRRKHLWFPAKGIRNNGRLTGSPLCCKRRRTMRLLCCALRPISLLSQALVQRGGCDQPFPPASSNDRFTSELLGFVQHVDRFL